MKFSAILPILTVSGDKSPQKKGVERNVGGSFTPSDYPDYCADQSEGLTVVQTWLDYSYNSGRIELSNRWGRVNCIHVIQPDSCAEIKIKYRSVAVLCSQHFGFAWENEENGFSSTPPRCHCFSDGCFNTKYTSTFQQASTGSSRLGPDEFTINSNKVIFFYESPVFLDDGHIIFDWECVRVASTTTAVTTTTSTSTTTTTTTTSVDTNSFSLSDYPDWCAIQLEGVNMAGTWQGGFSGQIMLSNEWGRANCNYVIEADSSCQGIRIKYQSVAIMTTPSCGSLHFGFAWESDNGFSSTPPRCHCFSEGCFNTKQTSSFAKYSASEASLHLGPDEFTINSNYVIFFYKSEIWPDDGHINLDWECISDTLSHAPQQIQQQQALPQLQAPVTPTSTTSKTTTSTRRTTTTTTATTM